MASLALWYGLGLAFGALILVLVVELYCLVRKNKMRIMNREDSEGEVNPIPSTVPNVVCCKSSPSLNHRPMAEQSMAIVAESDVELGLRESIECELIRLHNLAGPPRLLFTITEETKEDLESEDTRSRGGRTGKDSMTSFSDIVCLDSLRRNRVLGESSPPPKFKFMRDAEEKLLRKLLLEEAQMVNAVSVQQGDFTGGSFLGFLVGVHREQLHDQQPSTSS